MSDHTTIESKEATSAPPMFEICPVCSKNTASHLFRTVNQTKCCFFCAQAIEKREENAKAAQLDRKYHGGWLGRHILKVAIIAFTLIILRMALMHYLLSQGQQ